MDHLVFYSSSADPDAVQRALPSVEVLPVFTRRSLVEALVGKPELIGAIVDLDDADDDWIDFLRSATKSFPVLPILVIAPGDRCRHEFPCAEKSSDGELPTTRITEFVSVPRPRDRREHHRFDWPLRGRLEGGVTIHRIREISAGGAFLEPVSDVPPPGTQCGIEIAFQNFTMETRCEILDPRHVSSKARYGFGVRFVSLSEQGAAFIDGVVADAVARVLLDPSAEPEIPSIDDEEDILAVGDEFSLSL